MFSYSRNSSGEKNKYLLCVTHVSTILQDLRDASLNSFEEWYEVSFPHCM